MLVMALTLTAAFGVTFALAVKRASSLDQLSPAAVAQSAQAALSAKGRRGVATWTVEEVHRQPEIQVYFVNSAGEELLDRAVRGQPLPGAPGRSMATVTTPDGAVYRVLIRRTRGVVFDLWNIFLQPWVLLGLALTISGLGCAWLAWRLTRPILRLREGVRAVAAGDLAVRLGPEIAARRDELGGLARDFGQMTGDLQALIASKEELLRDISHELRSPLARLRLAAGLARRGPRINEEAFERIDREVERLDSMIGQILRFSRLTAASASLLEPLDLTELLEETVEDARIEADSQGVGLRLIVDGTAWLSGDKGQLRSALENVLRNAIRFSPPRSQVEVRLTRSAQEARVEVSDAGPGLREADLARVFEPFYRADPADGVGLGLAITARILGLHDGRVSARNLPHGGLCVEMVLPRGAASSLRGQSPSSIAADADPVIPGQGHAAAAASSFAKPSDRGGHRV
jgi:two-component system, OmpR family, sensor kinase